jgi:hypothetical protein
VLAVTGAHAYLALVKPRAATGYQSCERYARARGRVVTIEGWTGRLCEGCDRETRAGAEVERDREKLRELDRLREQRVTWTNRARRFAQRGRVRRRRAA